MDVLYRIRSAAGRFMFGRNGVDALNRALLGGYILLWAARLVALAIRWAPLGRIFDVLMNLLAIYILFRIFSTNLPRRQAENQWWLVRWDAVRYKAAAAKGRIMDREHRYFTCKECGTICRVPAKKGKIVITCPQCGTKRKAKT